MNWSPKSWTNERQQCGICQRTGTRTVVQRARCHGRKCPRLQHVKQCGKKCCPSDCVFTWQKTPNVTWHHNHNHDVSVPGGKNKNKECGWKVLMLEPKVTKVAECGGQECPDQPRFTKAAYRPCCQDCKVRNELLRGFIYVCKNMYVVCSMYS